MLDLFDLDLSAGIASDDWRAAATAFPKRHLIAHKMGVVDQDYMTKTRDGRAVLGRKVGIQVAEIRDLARIIRNPGKYLASGIVGRG